MNENRSTAPQAASSNVPASPSMSSIPRTWLVNKYETKAVMLTEKNDREPLYASHAPQNKPSEKASTSILDRPSSPERLRRNRGAKETRRTCKTATEADGDETRTPTRATALTHRTPLD
ncbi:hypothetical protein ROHU_031210 [Labeo rohita]|uniref:Uncharacterized protein n=1 Tax=Labeo rohita TaxID=84645 RepID=A0A498LNU1_LABRO|nr:hypothetical protein ROHU_031210 [Labeo rohita]